EDAKVAAEFERADVGIAHRAVDLAEVDIGLAEAGRIWRKGEWKGIAIAADIHAKMGGSIQAVLAGADFGLQRAPHQACADRIRGVGQAAAEEAAANRHEAPLRKVLDAEEADVALGLELIIANADAYSLRECGHIGRHAAILH